MLVTSTQTAAVQDMLKVLRRFPFLRVQIYHVPVQGDGSAEKIAAAIHHVSRTETFDLILLGRGGGSLEDLWEFNEEIVARAIFESTIPIVSAVGHEIDFTISDFVADLRAATPSAAAEIISEGVQASRQFILETREYLPQLMRRRLEQETNHLERLQQRLRRRDPRRLLNERLQWLDDLHSSLVRSARRACRSRHVNLANLQQRLLRLKPSLTLAQKCQQVDELKRNLKRLAQQRLKNIGHAFAGLTTRLRLLGPDNTLARGYSITTDADTGRIIRQASETKKGQRLQTQVQRGKINSRIED